MKTYVKSNIPPAKDGGTKVAIFEKDDRHEGGELFIGDNLIHEVAATSGVRAAQLEGKLVEAEEEDYRKQQDELEVVAMAREEERLKAIEEKRAPDYSEFTLEKLRAGREKADADDEEEDADEEPEGGDEGFTADELKKHSREELNTIASGVGVAAPEKLPNIDAVIDAILVVDKK